MKTGKTLEALGVEVLRRANSRKDYLADTRRVTPLFENFPALRLAGAGDTAFAIQPWAHGQLAEHAGIPQAYYDRMLRDAPALWQTNIGHWLREKPSLHLVRTLDDQVRAWLSDRYRPLDNEELIEAVLPALAEAQAEIVSAEITDKRLYIKALDPRLRGFIRQGTHEFQRFEDEIVWGICISNSEVGAGRLSVRTFFVRSICSNAAIVESVFGQFHLGGRLGSGEPGIQDSGIYLRDETRMAKDKALFLELRDVVRGTLTEAMMRKTLDKLSVAAGLPITGDVPKVVEVTARRLGLTDGERTSVLQHLIKGGDLTAWGLTNAVTRTAADSESYDRATEIERLGMQVIELPRRDWEIIAAAA